MPSSTPGSFVLPQEKNTGLVFSCQSICLFKLEALSLDSIRKLGLYTCTCAREYNHIVPASVSGGPSKKDEKEKAPEGTHGETKANLWISRRRQLDFGDRRVEIRLLKT